MKFQRNPSRARLLELAMAASRVAIDDRSCQATGVDADERILIESVRDELAIVIGAVQHSATGAEDLTDATVLGEAAQRIGGLLRRLNARGLYLHAEQRGDIDNGTIRARAGDARDHGLSASTVILCAIRARVPAIRAACADVFPGSTNGSTPPTNNTSFGITR
jgi:hypothetical protein